MITIREKHEQLKLTEKNTRRRFGINKFVLITAPILGAIGLLMPPLYVLILPAVTMLVIGFGYTLFAGKTKEQRAASTQIKLLRKVVQKTMLAKGIGADRVAEYM